MHLRSPPLLVAVALALGATATSLSYNAALSCSPTVSLNAPSIDAANATAFALMYGYPLVLYVQTFEPTLRALGANAIQNEEGLATEDAEVLVRPNVDTLYSKAAIDLSHADVVLSLPEIPEDRYHIVPFYDLYGNNFANLGSVISSPPGDYLLTIAGDNEPGLQMLYEDSYGGSKYKGLIKFPTTYGSIMLRIVLKNNNTDVDEVKAIQSRVQMTALQRVGEPIASALTPDLLGNGELSPAAFLLPFNFSAAQTTQTLQLLAQISASNPPVQRYDLDRVSAMLAAAGVKDGNYTAPPELDYSRVYKLVGEEFISLLNPSNHAFDQNGWFTLLPSMSGNFGTEYSARAYIAWFGYLQLADYVAAYPTYNDPTLPVTGRISMQLAANESYIMTFSEKPPVTGFWSLTAYNSTNYLVPNDLRRYSLGDRSNLTYADGTHVYGDASSNGAFSILIQPADVIPSSNWTDNWLPAPVGGGEFTVNLRWYGITPALSNGDYVYPFVTKQGSIL
ncbi:hypothetical protein BKA63DRAFT_572628 [Paraphoma chrysanthemicola]|nr:hypothetical protein BKA63DRAFT_572628 [Paraphoma chrysanthemicola]